MGEAGGGGAAAAAAATSWNVDVVPKTFKIISTRLSQRDVSSLLLVNRHVYQTLISCTSLWPELDLKETSGAGERLIAALSLPRFCNIKHINLEFARDIEDKHLIELKEKASRFIGNVEIVNLNGCQKISDTGIEALTSVCPKLRVFSIYWNVRATDTGIEHLVSNCKYVKDLNLSGCQHITDRSLELISESYSELESLDITRCVGLTDNGMKQVLKKCRSIKSLNLYALSVFTDHAYGNISLLTNLRFLDLCGAQNLTDAGLSRIAAHCRNLVSLNLTWCIGVSDEAVIAVARGCRLLEFLSLFGISAITDRCLEALSSHSLTTLDVHGCTGITKKSHKELLRLFPLLTSFKAHS